MNRGILQPVCSVRSVVMSDENRTEAILTATGAVLVKQADGSFREARGQTDWERLDRMKDEDIDDSDLPELNDAFFRTARCVDPPNPKRGTRR